MLPTLKIGARGDAVRLLGLLMDFDTAGVFDEALLERVKAFQTEHALDADGIVGSKTWRALISEALALKGFNEIKLRLEPFDFKQYDKRWAGEIYSSHGDKSQTIRSSGCGPTAMADIAACLDSSVTPLTMAKLALSRGDRTYSSGTAYTLFKHAADKYGFSYYEKTTSLEKLRACLSRGGCAVASMGKGYWTKGGHYICVYQIDDEYVHAHDPASSTRNKQKICDFVKERKMYFLFEA